MKPAETNQPPSTSPTLVTSEPRSRPKLDAREGDKILDCVVTSLAKAAAHVKHVAESDKIQAIRIGHFKQIKSTAQAVILEAERGQSILANLK